MARTVIDQLRKFMSREKSLIALFRTQLCLIQVSAYTI